MINLIKCKNSFAGFSILLSLFLFPGILSGQKAKVDSLKKLLAVEKTDTGKVKLMWQIARDAGAYNPDTALILAQQALYKAREIKYLEGESRSLGIVANTLIKIGNYPKALEYHIGRLKLEEKRNNPRNLGSVFNNIGVVYVMQDEYEKALQYYLKADSVLKKNHIRELDQSIALNKGDVYDKLNIFDSAYHYFSLSLTIARANSNDNYIGKSLTGLGHSFRKKSNYQQSLASYQEGIKYLTITNDDETYCEATLGLARLFGDIGKYDSSIFYSAKSLETSKKVGFLNKELDAAIFLTEQYRKRNIIDSAFAYINYVQQLNDSINSKDKIRESQIISSNEQVRQLQMEENKRIAAKERMGQLQMLLIAIFIPFFFLFTLLLSRVNIHLKLIRLMGVLSLLFLFEYLTLLLHPTVANFTHHNPILEILIFVVIAAILIPLHHQLEHWLIHKLIHHRHGKHALTPKESPEK